ncbi:hypothetical protein Droror1_Dr00013030 [Drosera rotundifolia]
MGQERKILDEVSGWLRIYNDGTVDRTWQGPPQVKFMAEPVPPHEHFVDGVATKDILIDANANLRVRVYLPEKTPGEDNTKLPVILHFHGGGFCISQADWYMYYAVYSHLARSVPAIIVSVYLRRAPEHRLPAAMHDAYSALLWLSSLSKLDKSSSPHDDQCSWLTANADFGRVFLIGDSSGGNIVHKVAAMAGKSSSELRPLTLRGAIPIHPGFMRAERSRSELEMPESPFLTLAMLDKFIALALPVGSTKDHPITCPMGTEAEEPMETLRIPPMLLCLAEKDLIRDTEMEYFEAMKKAGKDVELFVSEGMTHSFYLNKIAVDMDRKTKMETDRLIEKIVEFVVKH